MNTQLPHTIGRIVGRISVRPTTTPSRDKSRPTRTIVAGFIGMMLSGCTLIPDYVRPESPVATEWKQHDTAKPTPASANKTRQVLNRDGWQKYFTAPALQKLIRIALANNRDLRMAALNVQAAQALYRISRADLYPGATVGGGASRQKITEAQSSTGADYISSTYTANVGAAFELDLFGRVRSQNKAALEEYFATEEARNAVQVSLIGEVANAWLQLLADKKNLSLATKTWNTQQKTYNLIKKRVNNGISSKLDLAQVGIATATAKTSIARYTRLVQQNQHALLLLLGVSHYDFDLLGEGFAHVGLSSKNLVGLDSSLLLQRPDVLHAEYQLKSANANIGAARANFFPSISITGSYGYASSSLSKLFSSSAAGAWSFVPQISVPIFNAGRNRANLAYSKVQRKVLVANYEKSIQVAFREVADALSARKNLSRELQAQRELVHSARQAYKLSYARYKEGVDDFLTALDSQRTLFAAQQNEIATEQQYYANMVNLYKVLGGGVKRK
jgi:outer membrane protein, multidrug efflux system